MEIRTILTELIHNHILHSEPEKCEKLKGGTVSELYLLHAGSARYVLKLNEQKVTAAEAFFLDSYKGLALLPKLIFVDPANRYLVYSYLPGSTDYIPGKKKEMLETLAQELICNYGRADAGMGWGWADAPVDSWQEFLRLEIDEANKIIGPCLSEEDHEFASALADEVRPPDQPFLLHGDCGMHNFIFTGGELSGVIDPAPILGDPIYDCIDAFFSSPDELKKEIVDSAADCLRDETDRDNSALYKKAGIGLYLRIGTCMKHHPSDLPDYLKA